MKHALLKAAEWWFVSAISIAMFLAPLHVMGIKPCE